MIRNKILLLGSCELGREVVIALQRLGQYVVAVDSYANAPAMQLANDFEVINMLNGDELDRIVANVYNLGQCTLLIIPTIIMQKLLMFYRCRKKAITIELEKSIS